MEPKPIEIYSLELKNVVGKSPSCAVTLEIKVDGQPRIISYETSDQSVGPVSCICGAFRKVVPEFDWHDLKVRAVSPGENAEAAATVYIRKGRDSFTGDAAHNNTLMAISLAIAQGLSKLRWNEWSTSSRQPAYVR